MASGAECQRWDSNFQETCHEVSLISLLPPYLFNYILGLEAESLGKELEITLHEAPEWPSFWSFLLPCTQLGHSR